MMPSSPAGRPTTETLDEDAADLVPVGLVVCCAAGVRVHALDGARSIVLGRDPRCDVVVADATVSRRHAVLHVRPTPSIEDLGSRNGTFVSGRRLELGERARLARGTAIEIGSATLAVRSDAMPAKIERAFTVDETIDDDAPIVRSEAMAEIHDHLRVVAAANVPVLLLGETGTGKELLARIVHDHGPRAARPFLPLNCAALTDSLLDSELFGHERGAFTGATKAKEGLFEAADGGTLFLDEVGELPATTQAKLLRVLETGELLRVGSVRPRRVDVRIVAATNRDLRALVSTGKFRSDLFYRLDGFEVAVPPLRDRPEEILPLAEAFLRRAARRSGTPSPRIDGAALDRLHRHDWPGNVRELRNVIDRALVLAKGAPVIEREHLRLDTSDDVEPPRASPTTRAPANDVGLATPPTADDVERARVLDALQRTAGNQKEAARLLGIARQTLSRRLVRLGVQRPRARSGSSL